MLHFGLKKTEKQYSSLIYMREAWMESCELDLKLSIKIRENIFSGIFFRFTGKLKWETSSDEGNRGRASASPVA